MDALVMCGGRGTRLDADREKPLFEVGGRAMVDRVLDALAAADGVDDLYAAVSPHAPRTREHVVARGDVAVVDTPGDGYVADLDVALDAVGQPVVTATADLPLLAPVHVERALGARRDAIASGETGGEACACGADAGDEGVEDAGDEGVEDAGDEGVEDAGDEGVEDAGPSISVCVPAGLKELLGASVDAAFDGLVPTGLNVVDAGGDVMRTTYDARLAVNVNRRSDVAVATRLLEGER